MRLLAGTDKGLIIYQWDGHTWSVQAIHFLGMPIGAVYSDPITGHCWVAINHKHWGAKLHRSSDGGRHWDEVAAPVFPPHEGQTVKSIWTIRTGPGNRMYLGVEPAALFVSEDQGQSFRLLPALSGHASRDKWMGGGKGSKDPFLHTILIDPDNTAHLTVGISCAGVFQSWDEGETWQPTNHGLVANYLPNPRADVGHDPHVLRISCQNPSVIWQQNHCGIFRSFDKGLTWIDVTDSNKNAVYGFAMVIDESDDQRAWVVPAQSDFLRIPHHNALTVYTTTNGGKDWHPLTSGLPQLDSFDLVLRDAMDKQGPHLVFGTNNGNLYHSVDEGNHWQTVTQNLSTIRVVSLQA
ncbi:MAG: glycosyl hydrolase [Cyclobacteriaceae bacterium]|nr:glycosyl hydrolase [Cyclobacteriaceae bacterium]